MALRRRKLLFYLLVSIVGYFLVVNFISSSKTQDFDRFNRPTNSQQIADYLQWSNSTSCRLINDFGGAMALIAIDGQKAVCLDTEVRPTPRDCLVYSFGINNEWSFEDAMDSYGCDVYAFDPSMNQTADITHHVEGTTIYYFHYGLGSKDEVRVTNGWHLMSLSDLYRKLERHHGHGRIIDYLKIDIESDEWIALPQILQSGMMDRVRQLAVEVHLPLNGTIEEIQRCIDILRSIENYGMVRFDSKANVFSEDWIEALNMESYWAYELAWYNSRLRRKRTFYMI